MLVGVDKSLGMLQQAQPKAPGIAWVRADGSVMPFQSDSFDFLTCQFAFHHLRGKAGMLREAFRVLPLRGPPGPAQHVSARMRRLAVL